MVALGCLWNMEGEKDKKGLIWGGDEKGRNL